MESSGTTPCLINFKTTAPERNSPPRRYWPAPDKHSRSRPAKWFLNSGRDRFAVWSRRTDIEIIQRRESRITTVGGLITRESAACGKRSLHRLPQILRLGLVRFQRAQGFRGECLDFGVV